MGLHVDYPSQLINIHRLMKNNICFRNQNSLFYRFWYSLHNFYGLVLAVSVSQVVLFHLLQKLLSFCLGHCGGSGGFILTVLFLLMFRILIHSFFLQLLNLLRPIHTQGVWFPELQYSMLCISKYLISGHMEWNGRHTAAALYIFYWSKLSTHVFNITWEISLSGNIHTYVFLSNMYLLKIWLSQWLLFQI